VSRLERADPPAISGFSLAGKAEHRYNAFSNNGEKKKNWRRRIIKQSMGKKAIVQ
jgi:hypothetical protein